MTLRTTVYFATNRRVAGDGSAAGHYAGEAGPAGQPTALTFGTALVEGTDLPGLASGSIAQLDRVSTGDFSQGVRDDIAGGRNLLVFIHGFANSFTDSITRAAFNRDFLAASGVPEADCTVVCVSWPSRGVVVRPQDVIPGFVFGPLSLVLKLFGVPASPLATAYLEDKVAADASGPDVAAVLNGLRPIVTKVHQTGGRAFLLAHSMGNRVLRAATASLKSRTPLFDEVILTAADTDFDEGGKGPPFLRALGRQGGRVSQYVSVKDEILRLSQVVNGVQRLGRDGPVDRTDTNAYPPKLWRVVDCTGLKDTGPHGGVDASHQYYRRLTSVRDDIARVMAGGGRSGRTALA